jgi:histidinol-phosphate aminotransferase
MTPPLRETPAAVPGPRPRPEILTISPYVGGESRLGGVNRVIKLSSNEGAFGPPPGAVEAYRRIAGEIHRYPEGGAEALREAIGRRFGLDPARIVCGNGSDDILYQLALSYGGPGTELIMTRHGFSMYAIAGTYAGSRVIKVEERNRTASVEAILAALTPRTRLVCLANPNNPTGTLLGREEIARLIAGLPPEVLLVLDAAYAEYVTHPDYEPGAAFVDAYPNVVMTRTFSKIFGLGGLRLGWAYARPEVIDVLNRVRNPFNTNAAAQAAGIAALAEPGWVEKCRAHNATWRAWLSERLRAAGIAVGPSEGNFILADFGAPDVAQAADAHLRRHGIIVRPMGGYDLPACLRITIGTEEECEAVAAALTHFMQLMPRR